MGNKRNIKVQTNLRGNPRFEFVIDFLNHHPAFEGWSWTTDNVPAELILLYDQDRQSDYHWRIKYQPDFFIISSKIELCDWKLFPFEINDKKIYGIDKCNASQSLITPHNHLKVDVFSTIFFLISRYEEYFADELEYNKAGWLNESRHFLIKSDLNEIPIVDQLCFFLRQVFEREPRKLYKTTYSISHDIDVLYKFKPFAKFIKSFIASIWYKRGWSQLVSSFMHYFLMIQNKKSDPYDNFFWLLRSEKLWHRKFIFLMTGGTTKFDNKYSIDNRIIEEVLFEAQTRKYKVGLHPSYNAYNNRSMFRKEMNRLTERLKKSINLSRQHWLRWDWKTTPYILEEAGIDHDSSMGYNNHLGFRCGTGFPYRLYDFKNERTFNFMEHPFAYMESSAIHLSEKTSEDLIKLTEEFIKKNRNNTYILFNFHNSNFDPTTTHGKRLADFYRNRLIELIER